MNHKITEYLRRANPLTFILYGMAVAFCTYSCMYAFRKPIMAATFEGQVFWGIQYKVLIITAQVIGYTLSKFIGIKVVSELGGNKRAIAILLLIGISALGLFFFALTPAPYNLIFIFINGLPLGMVWGLVFNYLEGRSTTELLGVGLAVTQIFSSGFVKTIGSSLLLYVDIPEVWMPFATGIIFMLPLLLFVWLLNLIPAPSKQDVALRTARRPMNGKERWHFFVTFMPGLLLLVATYTFLTIYRDFRDNFSADIWKSLGYGKDPLIFTRTEIPIFLIVMIAIGAMIMVRNNYAAFFVNHWFVIFGVSLVGILTRLFEMGYLSPEVWMTGIGLGLYLAYTTFGLMIFERLMSTFKYLGTVGFIMYVADSSGYLGSVLILFYKNFAHPNIEWIEFFITMSYWLSGCCITMMMLSMAYFQYKYAQTIKHNFALEAQVS